MFRCKTNQYTVFPLSFSSLQPASNLIISLCPMGSDQAMVYNAPHYYPRVIDRVRQQSPSFSFHVALSCHSTSPALNLCTSWKCFCSFDSDFVRDRCTRTRPHRMDRHPKRSRRHSSTHQNTPTTCSTVE